MRVIRLGNMPEEPPLLILRRLCCPNLDAQTVFCADGQVVHLGAFNTDDFRGQERRELGDVVVEPAVAFSKRLVVAGAVNLVTA